MTKSERLQRIEASFRRAEESLRRGDPDTLAGRMPKEWRERDANTLTASKKPKRVAKRHKA